MDDEARAAWCHRGVDAIFDEELKRSINDLIDDVRAHGDEAVCRALARFDGVSLTPGALRATPDDIADACVDPDVDAAIDDAIARLKQLADLHQAGVLTAEEFAEQKARLLA